MSSRVQLITGFATTAIREVDGGLVVEGLSADGMRTVGPVDRIVAATGQRPDLSITRELRLDLDPWLEGVKALGPLIDPNEHSCGDVPPHGHRELSHPEPGFYTVGIKSYGRAPTFLLLTGYEQVRSVAAAIAGDLVSADAVHLALPETGVCTTTRSITSISAASKGCCGGPAPIEADACCVAHAEAKAGGNAVALGALVGPAQVGARAIEMLVARYHHPIWTKYASVTFVAIGVSALWAGLPYIPVALAFYGAGIGLESMARGTLPLALFRPSGYAKLIGRLAMPSLIAQAAAPSVAALLLEHPGAQGMLAALASLALANLLLALLLGWLIMRRRSAVQIG